MRRSLRVLPFLQPHLCSDLHYSHSFCSHSPCIVHYTGNILAHSFSVVLSSRIENQLREKSESMKTGETLDKNTCYGVSIQLTCKKDTSGHIKHIPRSAQAIPPCLRTVSPSSRQPSPCFSFLAH